MSGHRLGFDEFWQAEDRILALRHFMLLKLWVTYGYLFSESCQWCLKDGAGAFDRQGSSRSGSKAGTLQLCMPSATATVNVCAQQ